MWTSHQPYICTRRKLPPGVPMVILGHLKHGGGSCGAYGEIFGAIRELFYCLIIKNDKCGKLKS
jgi:hypothetical protein